MPRETLSTLESLISVMHYISSPFAVISYLLWYCTTVSLTFSLHILSHYTSLQNLLLGPLFVLVHILQNTC